MGDLRTFLHGFAGGELSPQLLGRPDDVRYPVSCQALQNMLPTPRGPAEKRRGLQHVARTKGDAKMRLLPFRFSAEQNLTVGAAAGFFRWYTNGRPLLFADIRSTASVHAGDDTLIFTEPHDLADGASVRVVAIDPGGVLPTPLDDVTNYTVDVVDAWRVKLDGQNLADSGTGVVRVVPAAQMPRTYTSSKNVLSINLNTNEIVFGIDHVLETGDAILFTGEALGGIGTGVTVYARKINNTTIKAFLTKQNAIDNVFPIDLIGTVVTVDAVSEQLEAPGGTPWFVDDEIVTVGDGTATAAAANLTAGANYFVVLSGLGSPQVISLSLTLGGAAINLAAVGGNLQVALVSARMHRVYENGDQVYLRSAPKGFYACVQTDPRDNTPGAAPTYWHRMGDAGELEIRNSYIEANLPLLEPSQSGDVLKIAHNDFDPGHLTRLSATAWKFEHPSYLPPLAAPSNLNGTTTRGARIKPTTFSYPTGTILRLTVPMAHALGNGEGVWAEGFAAQFPELTDGFYTAVMTAGDANAPVNFHLRRKTGELVTSATALGAGLITGDPTVEVSGLLADRENTYVVTALDSRRVESLQSAGKVLANNLLIAGTKNTLTWTAVTGAERYRVYRLHNGRYGLIGETDTTTFDDPHPGLLPSLATQPPRVDTFLPGARPQAIAHSDQRCAVGGFATAPPRVVLSRAGAETDFSYHIPVAADDRITFDVALDKSAVRHLVPIAEGLLVLTSSAVLLAEAAGDEALGPETVRVVTLPRIGSSQCTPVVLNDQPLFVAAQGQHVHAVVFNGRQVAVPDLSVRANHLFDGFTIPQLAAIQSPFPVGFAVRSDGVLLAASYMPAEDALGWARMVTGGTIESACQNQDGDEDALYCVVKRGNTRSVERILRDVFLDDAVIYDGTNTTAATVTVSGGVSWGPSDSLFLETSVALPMAVGDFVDVYEDVVAADGTTTRNTVRLTVESQTTGFLWKARPNGSVPASLRGAAVTTWMLGRKRVHTHLNSTSVSVKADGVKFSATTDAQGFLDMPAAAIVIHAGRKFLSRLKTLPFAVPQDFAQGKGITWNIAKVWVGVAGGPFRVFAGAARSQTVTPKKDEERVLLAGTWTPDGVLTIESDEPDELEIRYLAFDVATSGAQ